MISPKLRPDYINLSEWGIPMTVCVAAISETGKKIVGAMDRKLSFNEFSADNLATKFDSLGNDWIIFWSADNVSHVQATLRKAQKLYTQADENSVEEAATTICDAYQQQRRDEATAQHLSILDLSMEEFVAGDHGLPPEITAPLFQKINDIRLDMQFLACGFDKDKKAHIFTVTEPGVASFDNTPGFAAIGSGWNRAMSSLFFYPYNSQLSEALAVYHVCEAKFMAESASGVGAITDVVIFGCDESGINGTVLMPHIIEEIKQLWSKEGSPRLPSHAEQRLEAILARNTQSLNEHIANRNQSASKR